jgi:prepilin-type N-terminal cleavage/methylation domain-containing protein
MRIVGKQGFTLVELLVVIGIIALLISMLLPALNRARESAKRIACAAQLRQMGIAALGYAANNKGALPPINQDKGQPDYDSTTTGVGGVNFVRTLGFTLWGNSSTLATLQGAANETTDFNDQFHQNPVIGSNLGRLVAQRYLSGDIRRICCCPSTVAGPGDDLTQVAYPYLYNFNFHWVARSYPAGSTTYVVSPIKKIAQYKTPRGPFNGVWKGGTAAPAGGSPGVDWEWALASDPMALYSSNGTGNTYGYASHVMGSNRAYNLLYTDGSVRQGLVSNKVQRVDTSTYGRFLDVLGPAESNASGKPIHPSNSDYDWIRIVQ